MDSLTTSSPDKEIDEKLHTGKGRVNSYNVVVMRDPGCTVNIVQGDLVESGQYTGERVRMKLMNGYIVRAPTAKINVDCGYVKGIITACVMKSPVFPLIIGNTIKDNLSPSEPKLALAVVTRQQRKRELEGPKRKVAVKEIVNILSDPKLEKLQRDDPSLKKVFEQAGKGIVQRKGKKSSKFIVKGGILYRILGSVEQLVVPEKYRKIVFHLAHSAPLAGHQGKSRTLARIQKHFFWPGVSGEVNRWTASCDICQKTVDKGRVRPAPIIPLPVIGEPFARCAIDLVGPLDPVGVGGYRYMLVVTDFATKWPEAVPLKSISTEAVAEALLGIFTRLGIPKEVLSDQGSQFTGSMMREVFRLMAIKGIRTTPYHPQTNGACERLNGVLKKMLKRLSAEQPHLWPRFINPLLFAYREVEHKSTGYSPFFLMYGRDIRGPMHILKETLEGNVPQDEEGKTAYQYVLEMQERLEKTYALAQEELKRAGKASAQYINRRTALRSLQPKDKCLILLPSSANKLLAKWQGPFEIIEKVNKVNYRINVRGNNKVFHINMIKKYNDPVGVESNAVGSSCYKVNSKGGMKKETGYRYTSLKKGPTIPSVAEREELLETVAKFHETPIAAGAVMMDEEPGKVFTLEGEGTQEVEIGPMLTEEERGVVKELCEKYKTLFSDRPKQARVEPYKLKMRENKVIRSRPYSIPYHLKEKVEEEIREMEKDGYLEPSVSSYASPLVVVKKPDNKIRICGDYRKINTIVEFDAEPMANVEQIFANLAGSKIFSKMDLSKGFYQLPLAKESRQYTALATPLGLKQFTVVPFGLSISPAAFNRNIRQILQGIPNVEVFVDDVLVHTKDWAQHVGTLETIFQRFQEFGVSIKPSKCQLGKRSLEFLGHEIGEGAQRPQNRTIEKIQEFQRPTTKKGVRSFLGICGFYSQYIKNYTYLAQPLIKLTGKFMPQKVEWTEELERAFHAMKAALRASIMLRLPDLKKKFILQTDASNSGIGAALLQEDDDDSRYPVSYWSRKLKKSEVNYSTIEKECLAIVEACRKFQAYLYGAPFLLESDHMPLSFLKTQERVPNNARITRWILALQDFHFTIKYIPGKENVMADALSRQWEDGEESSKPTITSARSNP